MSDPINASAQVCVVPGDSPTPTTPRTVKPAKTEVTTEIPTKSTGKKAEKKEFNTVKPENTEVTTEAPEKKEPTSNGHGLQVVEVMEDHSYRLDEDALKTVLQQEGLRDLPVAVVSMAGAARGGKSFLLNFFLRYLTAPESARKDGSWIGDGEEPLTGFNWRGGSVRATSGIQLWSEPLIVTLPDNSKAVVLLMDTQGTFDNNSTVRDCSTIFALSTLMSSVQMFNVSGGNGVQEDDLQHLELFTQYGSLISVNQEGQKAFQVLDFLVRDWGNDFQFDYGREGGQQYLEQKVMEVSDDVPAELRELREHLRASFESIQCFLMPHPGLIVRKKTFDGKVKDIDQTFVDCLRELITSIFSPENLKVKKINGKTMKCGELFTFFKTYMKIFNSKEIPTPRSIVEATAEAGLLLAHNNALAAYRAEMDAACGEAAPAAVRPEVVGMHERARAAALASFRSSHTLATAAQAETQLEKLAQELNGGLPQYVSINIAKLEKINEEAKKAYDSKISEISGNNPFCVHALDVEAVNNEALEAINKVLGGKRELTFATDSVRQAFLEKFKRYKLELLRNQNEQNNKLAAASVQDAYLDYMKRVSRQKPPLTSSQLEDEHRVALQRALEQFKNKRSRPDQYENDIYKSVLTNQILLLHGTMMSDNSNKLEELSKELEKLASKQREHISQLKNQYEVLLHNMSEEEKHWYQRFCAIL